MSDARMPRLWLVRHAEPLVATGTCYGRWDVPASPQSTRTAAHRLAQALPRQLAAVRHSPLQRCELLAQELQALKPDLTSTPDLRLTEMDFGTWEGRAWSDIARADIDAWTDHFGDYRPGNGEALVDMLGRVALALDGAGARAHPTGHDVLWITHAGVVRCVLWLLEHGDRRPRSHEWTAPAPGFGEWTTVPLAAPTSAIRTAGTA